ncbi:hypothetical protein C4D14_RS01405 [Vibrio parahaemolyticus]|nr:hypothetical protein [Vibrio parahaemolyticus]EGR3062785.1 hypothetical protein [Vibrio parahaemolyticus]EGR3072932.1 hypothetical protein [Vibrio parahaemolyticus]EGR3174424.1 hypothetical protein [Vibrio parahaemolyticus]EJG0422922.1 hypothetical protein [Vibrio parahaemolyticus]
MLNNEAEYYLHENGSLIFKPHGGVQVDSALVKKVWVIQEVCNTPKRFAEWLKETREAGANRKDIIRIANNNKLSNYVPDWEYDVFGRFGLDDDKCIHGVSLNNICEHCDNGLPF